MTDYHLKTNKRYNLEQSDLCTDMLTLTACSYSCIANAKTICCEVAPFLIFCHIYENALLQYYKINVGQHHGQHVTFCGCSSIVERLFMCGLWPATPNNPSLAFTLDLMNKIHYLVLECQVSLRDISNFLQSTGRSQPEVKNVLFIRLRV